MVVLETHLEGIPLLARGKVRDIYDLGQELLFIASDRISAFDCILPNGIPDKGRVLTGISLFWFRMMADLVPNHVVTAEVEKYPAALRPFDDILRGRSMLVRKLDMFPVECVVRGYLVGSGWKEYQQQGTVCGIALPAGLRQADRLPEVIFTPATKAETGHDENIPFARMVSMVGESDAVRLRELSEAIYRRGVEHAASCGILLADTKFEFGRREGSIVLGDEVLTPDSSRFWETATYAPGSSPPSYDKQYVRDHLEQTDWNKKSPAPALPAEIVEGARRRYLEIYRRLTGSDLPG
ncbi:MAG: phosphoribosylaminoimidazolesuccinocarboxamide synthase [Acidobacteria bacterium]|nr:MAG: phosphoribosylaminoimidazolesuccinocarboxamide synthase [Acidobacteriota bacterium]TDI41557.1 MAG: phosphoribosylaminoimidazolesuccinocarboxamide synthase [Acidobacteriota bacterium]